MNVHIVCHTINGEHVIARLARLLCARTGWTASNTPNARADINYFFPYLEWKAHALFDMTPTAAWFTHRDESLAGKVPMWEGAARGVDLRLTSAPIYLPELAALGDARRVTPPVDMKYQPRTAAPERLGKPLVGVSGMIYPGGRKGEHLAASLAREGDVLVRAAGRGWPAPIRTTYYEPGALPAFYQSLDVFLCTALIEGIPLPPLEALACGVPVVVPRGVGLLDELPDMPGIYRYPANDYDGMRAAVEAALARTHDPAVLAGAVTPYTAEAWVNDHVEAFEALLNPAADVETLGDWHGHAGIYAVAFGGPARTCAERLLTSCAEHMPDVPTALVSSAPVGGETVFIAQEDYDIGARLAKLRIDELAPADWQYVLYLDADTEMVAPVPFLFDALQAGWEMVICTNPGKFHSTRMMVRPDNREEVMRTYDVMGYDDLLQLNGGVFAFRRNARTAAFFARWVEEWKQEAKRDQAALLRALWAHPLRVLVLTNVWNTFDEYNEASITAGILHHQKEARRVSGIVWERGDSEEAFKRVVK